MIVKAPFMVESPDLPQFPVGTQVALLRQMMLLDRDCELVPGPLTVDR
jgi:hypothetical protein